MMRMRMPLHGWRTAPSRRVSSTKRLLTAHLRPPPMHAAAPPPATATPQGAYARTQLTFVREDLDRNAAATNAQQWEQPRTQAEVVGDEVEAWLTQRVEEEAEEGQPPPREPAAAHSATHSPSPSPPAKKRRPLGEVDVNVRDMRGASAWSTRTEVGLSTQQCQHTRLQYCKQSLQSVSMAS